AQAAAQAQAAAEAAQAAAQAQANAAIETVKEFPLDGKDGSVAARLRRRYASDPAAGQEQWSASKTADDVYLVEYRFVPSRAGAQGAQFLFEADMGPGLVIGKNLPARKLLSGEPAAERRKPKPRPKPKRRPVRRAVRRVEETPKQVPLLPLPQEGALRPPAEDDGAFGSDTVNSGI
ncbi:MAG: hypothetical protein KGM24_04460, partial [Elusimicrobia bacterium]|nr:hypothetical protein [Elusimicrobiota bacterium]